MAKASGSSFKDTYGVSSTFTGGFLAPEDIKIVGVDIPLEDWNADLWDEARLAYAQAHPIDPASLIKTTDMGGSIPPVSVTKRKGLILAVEGRRRILGTRAANAILVKKGVKPDALIELAIFVDRGEDLETSVRIGNEGRLDDPPWVKAQNAQRLAARGKGPDQIRTIFGVEKQTVDNWFHYLACAPEIRAQVENEALTKDLRLPFAIGIELGKLGKGEHEGQAQVLAKARAMGAALTGERGRENVKALGKAWKAGTLDQVAQSEAPAAPPSVPEAPPAQPLGQALVPSHAKPQAPPPAPPVGKCNPKAGAQCAFHKSGGRKASDCSPEALPVVKAPKGAKEKAPKVEVRIQGQKLSPAAIREIQARLEPTEHEPHEDEMIEAVYAAFLVITGEDPQAQGLKRWPHIHAAFKPVTRSEKVK